MKYTVPFVVVLLSFSCDSDAAELMSISRADYEDRVSAIWHGQIIGVLLALPFEHNTASVRPVTGFPRLHSESFVDDDWYYEMCAVRAFEKHGIGLTAKQLGSAMAGELLWFLGFQRDGTSESS